MLLFIELSFATSAFCNCISIHLMLLFIPHYHLRLLQSFCISIHLMLLFIHVTKLLLHPKLHFNTSHVTVYPQDLESTKLCLSDFNTSHVTVYPYSTFFMECAIIFQYISCYCLSGAAAQRERMRMNFNTSHVTVYLCFIQTCKCSNWISIHLMLLFIRIRQRSDFKTVQISIHLMLLFIN